MARDQMPWGWRYELRELIADVTQSPLHIVSFVLCTITFVVFMFFVTSALFGWPYGHETCNPVNFPSCP